MILCNFLVYSAAGRASFLLPGDFHLRQQHRTTLYITAYPLHPQNVPDILKLVKRIRAECPGKDIWVWTGYKLDELNATQMQVVDLINVLVDGKFVQDLKDPSLIWRGSSNQVVHHLR